MYDEFNRLLSFCSVRQALLAEEVMQRCGLPGALIPTPRKLDIHCGQCMLFPADNEARVLALLQQKNIRWAKLFIRNTVADTYALDSENSSSNEEDIL